MAKEIERKFLVKDDSYKINSKGILCLQGYIANRNEAVVRVRVFGDKGYLTVKGQNNNYSRDEYEYEIPIQDAKEMLENLSENFIIEKTRYEIFDCNKNWIVDEFIGYNSGLVIAEIELSSEYEEFDYPKWLGKEITMDFRYAGSNLSIKPYSIWE